MNIYFRCIWNGCKSKSLIVNHQPGFSQHLHNHSYSSVFSIFSLCCIQNKISSNTEWLISNNHSNSTHGHEHVVRALLSLKLYENIVKLSSVSRSTCFGELWKCAAHHGLHTWRSLLSQLTAEDFKPQLIFLHVIKLFLPIRNLDLYFPLVTKYFLLIITHILKIIRYCVNVSICECQKMVSHKMFLSVKMKKKSRAKNKLKHLLF